jgi:hypothetical protein
MANVNNDPPSSYDASTFVPTFLLTLDAELVLVLGDKQARVPRVEANRTEDNGFGQIYPRQPA